MFSLTLSLKAIAFATATWWVVTNLDNLLDRLIRQQLGITKDTTLNQVIMCIISFVLAIVVMWRVNLNVGDILGENIPEPVQTIPH